MKCEWSDGDAAEPIPCARPYAYDVQAGYSGQNGFGQEWATCEKHAREAKAMGFKVEGMEDADDDGM